MAHPITCTTTSHVTTRGSPVTAPAPASPRRTSARNSASAALSVSVHQAQIVNSIFQEKRPQVAYSVFNCTNATLKKAHAETCVQLKILFAGCDLLKNGVQAPHGWLAGQHDG